MLLLGAKSNFCTRSAAMPSMALSFPYTSVGRMLVSNEGRVLLGGVGGLRGVHA
jgi:hypothetical protein